MTALSQAMIRGTEPEVSGSTTTLRRWRLTAGDASSVLSVSSNGPPTRAADIGSAARIFGSASSSSSVP